MLGPDRHGVKLHASSPLDIMTTGSIFHREQTRFTLCKAFLIRNDQCFPEVSQLLIGLPKNWLKKAFPPSMYIEKERILGKFYDSWIDNDHLWALSSGKKH